MKFHNRRFSNLTEVTQLHLPEQTETTLNPGQYQVRLEPGE